MNISLIRKARVIAELADHRRIIEDDNYKHSIIDFLSDRKKISAPRSEPTAGSYDIGREGPSLECITP